MTSDEKSEPVISPTVEEAKSEVFRAGRSLRFMLNMSDDEWDRAEGAFKRSIDTLIAAVEAPLRQEIAELQREYHELQVGAVFMDGEAIRQRVRAERAEAALTQQQGKKEKDHGAELIGQTIPDMAGTEPRPVKERCICAAVLLPDGRKVFGHRHWDAMQNARDLGFTELVTQQMQGFITTQGRFVDRVEGLALQEAAGIKSARGAYNGRALFSEDLY